MPPKEWKCRSGVQMAEKPCASANFAPSISSVYLGPESESSSLAKYDRLSWSGREASSADAPLRDAVASEGKSTRRPRDRAQRASSSGFSGAGSDAASQVVPGAGCSRASRPAKKPVSDA
ncbi:hypothetical protein [Corallococcus sp. 4LFB]|uniref:hypothetical protein n=1 Tax=Corallococcus sp. 4LFB TaxID=3383249 RepID=UPI00397516B5